MTTAGNGRLELLLAKSDFSVESDFKERLWKRLTVTEQRKAHRNEHIEKFIKRVESDQELQAKFSLIRDPGEAYELARSVQTGFTKEEFVTELQRICEEQTRDLSEDDLAMVAGGKNEALPKWFLSQSV